MRFWSFVGVKKQNIPPERKDDPNVGDFYTWVALDPDTKLVPSFMVGKRTRHDAAIFMADLANRLAGRVQLSTDGFAGYTQAVPFVFGKDVDFAQVLKHFGKDELDDSYYGPAKCIGETIRRRVGSPDPRHATTSHVERQNLTMRMGMRRFTRLTNAFSKKAENLAHAVSLHFMHYNFCRVHKTLGVTPAMEAGISDHAWTIEELVGLLDDQSVENEQVKSN